MKQWDIFPFTEENSHLVVIISNDERCANKDLLTVNALFCRTIRPAKPVKELIEVQLDKADGLDWSTAVNCELIRELPKTPFQRKARTN